MNKILDLLDAHFDELHDKNVLDFNDGYSKLLGPVLNFEGNYTDLYSELSKLLINNKMARYRHINYFTFKKLFTLISDQIRKPVILETGSSAYGTNSSVLLANLAVITDGQFDTIDLNKDTYLKISNSLYEKFGVNENLNCHFGDSIEYINKYPKKVNVVYLDSFDLNPDKFNESAQHGLGEFDAIKNKLAPIAFILIDDTPSTIEIFKKMCSSQFLQSVYLHFEKFGRLPGKGELILESITSDPRFTIIEHQYQLLIQYKDPSHNEAIKI